MLRLPRPAIAGLCTLAATVLTIGLLHTVSAQAVPPAVATNKTGYLAGETVVISGVGFTSGDVVTLRVTHADGSSEAGGNHDAFTAIASDAGVITASWALGAGPTEDLAGNEFVLTASTVAGALAPVAFSRIAVIGTDKYDYQPGETVVITGGGFRGGEFVTLQVLHTSGLNDSAEHLPFEVRANEAGEIKAGWRVEPHSLGKLLRIQAVGAESGLRAVTAFTDAFLTFADDQGPDDEPGQKDLSYLQFEETNPNPNYAVRWAWDDTGFSGNNSGDGCALFDTNANGFADHAVCVSIKNSPATLEALTVYTCGQDSRSDRCAGRNLVVTNGTTAQASVVANVDPFRFNPLHTTGNTCSVTTGCYTADTVADVSITPADAGGAGAKLINVCSFPSGLPNSDPNDCIFVPGSGFLRIVKVVQGVSTLFPQQFTFNASVASRNGTTQWVSPSFTANGTQTVVSQVSYVPGGTLDLSEVVPDKWTLSSAACTLSSGSSTGTPTANRVDNITIQEGLITTCTFTNTEDLERTHARLTLVKIVTNDNGGTAVVSDFTLSATGTTSFSGAGGSNAINNQLVVPGSYTLAETQVNGYTASSWSCTDGTLNGDTLALVGGDSATCTITNDDIAPSLTLVKNVVSNNGGSALASAWELTATGAGAAPTNLSGAGGASSGAGFKADTYSLAETGTVAGYTNGTTYSCVKNGAKPVDTNTIALANGDSATCTITNDDIAPSLTLVKNVVSNNGGSALASAWELTATGAGASPTNLSGAGGASSGAGFKADTYSLAETGTVAGYTNGTTYSCVKNGAKPVDTNTIALANGDSATCTITNDDIAPSLTLVKNVVSNNGGSALASAWELTATGAGAAPTNLSGAGGASSGAGFKADTYSLAETGTVAGYTNGTTYSCVKNGAKPVDTNTIALANGDSATCTITNDDIAPSLTLVKNVVSNNGGSALASAWELTATGAGASPTNLSGAGGASSGAGFKADTYSLAETGTVAGYTNGTTYSCVKNGAKPVDTNTIALANGDSATCTITNDDIAPSLTLVKNVVSNNGGSALASAWELTATGAGAAPTNLSGAGGASSGAGFKADTYSLAETGTVAGYTNGTTYSCVKNGAKPVDTNTIALANGDSATCTITNDDIAPSLTLVKNVVSNNGGSALASAWELTATGAGASPTNLSGAGGASSGAGFKADTYSLAETGTVAGYTNGTTYSCVKNGAKPVDTNTIALANGDSATCTITNDDIPARLTVNKVCAPTTDDGLFDLKIDTVVRADDAACGGTTGEVLINAGTHYVTEAAGTGTNLADYVTSIGGACTPAGAVTLGLGQSATCTITNTRKGKATVVKTVAGLTPASNQTFTFELRSGAAPNADGTVLETKTTDATGNINFSTLLVPSQTYQICEWVMPGWNTNLSGDGPLFVPNSIIPPSLPNPNVNNMAVCANFTVTPGQERTFTVDNTPPPGGRALTIGFWKNWASCSGSKGNGQDPMLDLALAIATQQTPNPPDGMVVSAGTMGAGWPIFGPTYYLILKGDPNSTPDNILPAPGCAYAVSLLDKRTTVSGKKMASDPLFNMTAQLVAAEANRFMGAGISGDTIMNINKAVVLDGKYEFNGNGYKGKLTAADAAYANCLATELDNYNNNRPVTACQTP